MASCCVPASGVFLLCVFQSYTAFVGSSSVYPHRRVTLVPAVVVPRCTAFVRRVVPTAVTTSPLLRRTLSVLVELPALSHSTQCCIDVVAPEQAAVVGGITPASLFLASSAVTAEDIGVFIEDENSVAPGAHVSVRLLCLRVCGSLIRVAPTPAAVLIAVERLSKAIPHEAHFEETAGRLRMRAQNTATTVLSCLRIASRAGLEGTELYANCIAEITATVVDEVRKRRRLSQCCAAARSIAVWHPDASAAWWSQVGLLLTFRGNLHCRAFEENLEAIEKEAVRQLQLLQLLCRTAVVDTTAEAAEHVSAGATMGSTAGQGVSAALPPVVVSSRGCCAPALTAVWVACVCADCALSVASAVGDARGAREARGGGASAGANKWHVRTCSAWQGLQKGAARELMH